MEKVEFAEHLVREAGARIKKMMESELQVSEKTSKSDLVTNADKETETFLVAEIQKAYEHQNFLTEEKTIEIQGLEDLWIIDPIDGTTNFIYQKKHFAISVAHYNRGEPVFGIVYDVMADQMYVGVAGGKATLNGEILAPLDQKQDLSHALLTGDVFRPDFFKVSPKELKPQFITHRFLGSGAIEVCEVAAGHFQAYVFPKIKTWDIAAAIIVLQCVGGTWLFGEDVDTMTFTNDPKVILAASNPIIRDTLRSFL